MSPGGGPKLPSVENPGRTLTLYFTILGTGKSHGAVGGPPPSYRETTGHGRHHLRELRFGSSKKLTNTSKLVFKFHGILKIHSLFIRQPLNVYCEPGAEVTIMGTGH